MIRKTKPCTLAEHTRVALRVHTALWMMAGGGATIEEWRDLSDAINVVEALAEMGKLPSDHLETTAIAIDGMVSAITQWHESHRMRMTGHELEALRIVVNEYDSALGRFSQSTMAQAKANVIVRIAQAKGQPDLGMTVVDA